MVSWKIVCVLLLQLLVLILRHFSPNFIGKNVNSLFFINIDELLGAKNFPDDAFLVQVPKKDGGIPRFVDIIFVILGHNLLAIVSFLEVSREHYYSVDLMFWHWNHRVDNRWIWQLLLLWVVCGV